LEKEADEILKQSGEETADELAAKSALADEKNHPTEIYTEKQA